MNYQELLERVLAAVDEQAYQASTSHLDPRYAASARLVGEAIADSDVSAFEIRALIDDLEAAGKLDRVTALSSRHILAASPKVKDYAAAARFAGEQEVAALELGGPNLNANLACVDRHRGVLAYLQGHYDLALDYFTRAFERERRALNVQNILCTLLKLGEHTEALDLYEHIRRVFPAVLVRELDDFIHTDPDLAVLRAEIQPQ